MPLRVRIASTMVTSAAQQVFVADCRLIFKGYAVLRHGAKIPASTIEVVLADDFVDEVKRNMRSIGDQEDDQFTTERVGGKVIAKVMPQTADYSRVVIVFDAALWRLPEPVPGDLRLHQFMLVAHELAHPILDRALNTSGALEGVPFPSHTGIEIARSCSRILAEEYRAERLSYLMATTILKAVAPDGTTQSLDPWSVWGDSEIADLLTILRQAYPRWPDLVQDYREHRIDLMSMWGMVVPSIDQTLTHLIRVQAHSDAAMAADPIELEDLAELPAVKLYIAEPWRGFMQVLRGQPLLPAMGDVRAYDQELVQTGEGAIRSIWRKLGLEIEERSEREWAVWVTAPRR